MEFVKENSYLYLLLDEDDLHGRSVDYVLEHGWHYRWVININDHTCHLSDDEEISVKIGTLSDDFYKINKDVFGLANNFYFDSSINFNIKMFILPNRISILKKIDNIIKSDFYVVQDINLEGDYVVPIKEYRKLINNFPNATEKERYADLRVSEILSNYFPNKEEIAHKYKRIVEKKNKILNEYNKINVDRLNVEFRLEELSNSKEKLEYLISHCDQSYVNEQAYQAELFNVLKVLFPKYIYAAREIKIPGIDTHDKRPDFLVSDFNGHLDVIEIKKPNALLLKKTLYRNNYVPSPELVGVIQQAEKYAACLNKCDEKQLNRIAVSKEFKEDLPKDWILKSINPQAIIIIGNAKSELRNKRMIADFELIKRQYKHISDIFTYDELLKMIDNSIKSLKKVKAESDKTINN